METKMKKTGFTLIELLVVIVIIGILSTISTATFKSYFGKARDAERVSAVQSIALMMKVDASDVWGDAKYVGTDLATGTTINTSSAEFIASLSDLFSSNDFRIPKAGKQLRYYIAASTGDTDSNGATGDNNQFIVATWGETKSTEKDKKAGVIADGTELAMKGDGSQKGFASTTENLLSESDFRTGGAVSTLYQAIEVQDSQGNATLHLSDGLVEAYISPSGRLVDDITIS